MFDGTLDLTGTYDDRKQPAPFDGKLRIDHYTLRNSEILARILSIASITGMVNMLTNNGIEFDHMTADIHHLKGIVDVKNGHTSGNSLGITVEGPRRHHPLRPRPQGRCWCRPIFFNSIVTKIPLIGKARGRQRRGG
ncbi:MAG: hypothetical protein WDN72_05640 [Alphaproteobacteria bacterium]